MPELLRAAAFRFKAALAGLLQNLGDRTIGKEDGPAADLQGALVELEQTEESQINTVADANVAAQIRAWLALYQHAVPIALQLARLQAG